MELWNIDIEKSSQLPNEKFNLVKIIDDNSKPYIYMDLPHCQTVTPKRSGRKQILSYTWA